MVKKVERDGKIGVLISCGYGAGWSTWCGVPDKVEEMVFSPEIIELVGKGWVGIDNKLDILAKEKHGRKIIEFKDFEELETMVNLVRG